MSQQPFGTVHTNEVFFLLTTAHGAMHEENQVFFVLYP